MVWGAGGVDVQVCLHVWELGGGVCVVEGALSAIGTLGQPLQESTAGVVWELPYSMLRAWTGLTSGETTLMLPVPCLFHS